MSLAPPQLNTFRGTLVALVVLMILLSLTHEKTSTPRYLASGKYILPETDTFDFSVGPFSDSDAETFGTPTTCHRRRQMALTFDEGPSPKITPVVLDVLKKKRIHATFHVSLPDVLTNEHRDLLQRAYSDGHLIGIRFPPGADPRLMSDDHIKHILQREMSRLKDIIGVYPKFLRLPEHQYDLRVRRLVQEWGLVDSSWAWKADDYQWSHEKDDMMVYRRLSDSLMSWLKRGQGKELDSAIVVMHDRYSFYEDKAAVHVMLEDVMKQGWQFVSLDECLQHEVGYLDAPI